MTRAAPARRGLGLDAPAPPIAPTRPVYRLAVTVRDDLRRSLTAAMKARDPVTVAALRSALAAIDNAEAADITTAPAAQPGHIAGGVAGLGSGEVPRRTLTDADMHTVVRHVIDERARAAAQYETLGRHEEAAHVRAEINALEQFLQP